MSEIDAKVNMSLGKWLESRKSTDFADIPDNIIPYKKCLCSLISYIITWAMNKIQIYIPKFYKFLNKSVSWCKDNGKRSVKRCPVSEPSRKADTSLEQK
ncbi:hypothetical protein M0804_002682 [Polistes exclamans]|nr:hypothetical protein M0804_002682 [Polistes exclamans]